MNIDNKTGYNAALLARWKMEHGTDPFELRDTQEKARDALHNLIKKHRQQDGSFINNVGGLIIPYAIGIACLLILLMVNFITGHQPTLRDAVLAVISLGLIFALCAKVSDRRVREAARRRDAEESCAKDALHKAWLNTAESEKFIYDLCRLRELLGSKSDVMSIDELAAACDKKLRHQAQGVVQLFGTSPGAFCNEGDGCRYMTELFQNCELFARIRITTRAADSYLSSARS
jgi:hypothetical protein